MPVTLANLATGESHELPRTTLIGRSPESNVLLTDPRASRRHAMIRQHEDGHYFYDLGSFNGSYLNNMRVTTNRRLENGDVLRIADAEFRFLTSATRMLDDEEALLSSTIPLIKKMPVIVLVSDVVGYTKLSEKLPPDELAQAIGTWYGDCDQILSSHGATIDKFLGDAVLAYWDQVSLQARKRALCTAHELLGSCARIQTEHSALFKKVGLGFRAGIALHAGEVASGRMGAGKGDFTLVGDTVNITFRIEELTRTLGKDVVVTREFLAGWEEGAALCSAEGEYQIKGRVQPVDVFSVERFPDTASA